MWQPENVAKRRFSNVIGIDDAPFVPRRGTPRAMTKKVKVVGALFARLNLHGVILFEVTEDGDDAAAVLAQGIVRSKFLGHIQLIMLQGIALGGLNVVDVPWLSKETGRPVLVVARRAPDMDAMERALSSVKDGDKKLAIIHSLGPMEPIGGVYCQRYGLSREEAEETLRLFCVNGLIPEPIRVAHLIGGALVNGVSSGRA